MVGPIIRDPISGQAVFETAKDFLGLEFGVPVHITGAEESHLARALTALPSGRRSLSNKFSF